MPSSCLAVDQNGKVKLAVPASNPAARVDPTVPLPSCPVLTLSLFPHLLHLSSPPQDHSDCTIEPT